MIITLLSLAMAQPTPDLAPQPEIRYASRTEVDFDKALQIEGELVKPAISEVSETRRLAFASFINLRTNFDPEIRSSASLVR